MACGIVTADLRGLDAARAPIPFIVEGGGAVLRVMVLPEGSVELLSRHPGAAEKGAADLRHRPGVMKAEPLTGYVLAGGDPRKRASFEAFLPLDPDAPPVIQDGILQASPGEGFTVEYAQPDGTRLASSDVVR